MTKAAELRSKGATLYYRDCKDNAYGYFKGKVTDFKTVPEAQEDWDQQWSHANGVILEIEPLEEVDEMRKKYRHLSSVLTPEGYKKKLERKKKR